MNDYRDVFTAEAKEDLDEIFEYLSQFYQSTVEKFKTALFRKIDLICANPYIC